MVFWFEWCNLEKCLKILSFWKTNFYCFKFHFMAVCCQRTNLHNSITEFTKQTSYSSCNFAITNFAITKNCLNLDLNQRSCGWSFNQIKRKTLYKNIYLPKKCIFTKIVLKEQGILNWKIGNESYQFSSVSVCV